MFKRRRFSQSQVLEIRLAQEAERLRQQAMDTPPGVEQERLIRNARQMETASHLTGWINSPGLQPPK